MDNKHYFMDRLINIISPITYEQAKVEVGGEESELRELLATIFEINPSSIKGLRDLYGNYFTLSSAIKNPTISLDNNNLFTLIIKDVNNRQIQNNNKLESSNSIRPKQFYDFNHYRNYNNSLNNSFSLYNKRAYLNLVDDLNKKGIASREQASKLKSFINDNTVGVLKLMKPYLSLQKYSKPIEEEDFPKIEKEKANKNYSKHYSKNCSYSRNNNNNYNNNKNKKEEIKIKTNKKKKKEKKNEDSDDQEEEIKNHKNSKEDSDEHEIDIKNIKKSKEDSDNDDEDEKEEKKEEKKEDKKEESKDKKILNDYKKILAEVKFNFQEHEFSILNEKLNNGDPEIMKILKQNKSISYDQFLFKLKNLAENDPKNNVNKDDSDSSFKIDDDEEKISTKENVKENKKKSTKKNKTINNNIQKIYKQILKIFNDNKSEQILKILFKYDYKNSDNKYKENLFKNELGLSIDTVPSKKTIKEKKDDIIQYYFNYIDETIADNMDDEEKDALKQYIFEEDEEEENEEEEDEEDAKLLTIFEDFDKNHNLENLKENLQEYIRERNDYKSSSQIDEANQEEEEEDEENEEKENSEEEDDSSKMSVNKDEEIKDNGGNGNNNTFSRNQSRKETENSAGGFIIKMGDKDAPIKQLNNNYKLICEKQINNRTSLENNNNNENNNEENNNNNEDNDNGEKAKNDLLSFVKVKKNKVKKGDEKEEEPKEDIKDNGYINENNNENNNVNLSESNQTESKKNLIPQNSVNTQQSNADKKKFKFIKALQYIKIDENKKNVILEFLEKQNPTVVQFAENYKHGQIKIKNLNDLYDKIMKEGENQINNGNETEDKEKEQFLNYIKDLVDKKKLSKNEYNFLKNGYERNDIKILGLVQRYMLSPNKNFEEELQEFLKSENIPKDDGRNDSNNLKQNKNSKLSNDNNTYETKRQIKQYLDSIEKNNDGSNGNNTNNDNNDKDNPEKREKYKKIAEIMLRTNYLLKKQNEILLDLIDKKEEFTIATFELLFKYADINDFIENIKLSLQDIMCKRNFDEIIKHETKQDKRERLFKLCEDKNEALFDILKDYEPGKLKESQNKIDTLLLKIGLNQ